MTFYLTLCSADVLLPEWGIVITTTKTILVPKGVALRTTNPTHRITFRIDRRSPRRYENNDDDDDGSD